MTIPPTLEKILDLERALKEYRRSLWKPFYMYPKSIIYLVKIFTSEVND